MCSHRDRIISMLISRSLKKLMDVVFPDEMDQDVHPNGADDTGVAKRLLEGDGITPPEPKRARIDNEENSDNGPYKGSHVSGPSGTSETTRELQKGKQSEKNKGRRRGTRPRVEDHADRPKTPRMPKKQSAVLIGFSGTNYAGMQM